MGDLIGVHVPARLDLNDGSIQYLRLQEPTDLSVQLPDGRALRLSVKYVSFGVERRTVVDINLIPQARSLPYKQALAGFKRHMQDLGLRSDQRMEAQMALWPEDSPGYDPVNRPGFYPLKYRAGMKLADDLDFDVELRAANDGGWFTVLTFAVSGDTRSRIAGLLAPEPATRPATRPAESQGE